MFCRCATPEVRSANKRERDERLAAARLSRSNEQSSTIQKAMELRARAAGRAQFVDEAVAAYEEALAQKMTMKDEEMVQMQQQISRTRQRKKNWFEKQWHERQAMEAEMIRSAEMRRTQSDAKNHAIIKGQQRQQAQIRSNLETFRYEKAITAEFLVSSVEGKRSLASRGFPVATAPRQTASHVMHAISSVYLAHPRSSSSTSRPHTSLGFSENHSTHDSQMSSRRSSHSATPCIESQGAQTLELSAHDKEAAHSYLIRFGKTTKNGNKVMPFERFNRMLLAMRIVPVLLVESDIVELFNLARGAEGWTDMFSQPLSGQQFFRAVFHVAQWTGCTFQELSIRAAHPPNESFTNRKEWSGSLRPWVDEHPLLSKSIEASASGSLSSFAQSSLPSVLDSVGLASGLPNTPLLGCRVPRSKKEYLDLRKHMKVARHTTFKATGDIPEKSKRRPRNAKSADEAHFFGSVFLGNDMIEGCQAEKGQDQQRHLGGLDDSLPSLSPSVGLLSQVLLHHTVTCCSTRQHTVQHTATHSRRLQHTATHSRRLLACNCRCAGALRFNTLQDTVTQCQILDTATQCQILLQSFGLPSPAEFAGASHCNTR